MPEYLVLSIFVFPFGIYLYHPTIRVWRKINSIPLCLNFKFSCIYVCIIISFHG